MKHDDWKIIHKATSKWQILCNSDMGLAGGWKFTSNDSSVTCKRCKAILKRKAREAVRLAEKEAEYVKRNGSFCPYCGSHEIEGGHAEIMDNGVEVGVECHACGKTWTDLYKLAGIIEDE